MARKKRETESSNDGHPPRKVTCTKASDGKHKSVVTRREVDLVLERNAGFYGRREPGVYGQEHVRCEHCGKLAISSFQRIADSAVAAVWAFLTNGPAPTIRNGLDRLNDRRKG